MKPDSFRFYDHKAELDKMQADINAINTRITQIEDLTIVKFITKIDGLPPHTPPIQIWPARFPHPFRLGRRLDRLLHLAKTQRPRLESITHCQITHRLQPPIPRRLPPTPRRVYRRAQPRRNQSPRLGGFFFLPKPTQRWAFLFMGSFCKLLAQAFWAIMGNYGQTTQNHPPTAPSPSTRSLPFHDTAPPHGPKMAHNTRTPAPSPP